MLVTLQNYLYVLVVRTLERVSVSAFARRICQTLSSGEMLDKGVPLPTVSKLLGHANVQTTARIYAGVLEGREQRTQALVELAFAGSGDHEVATARSRQRCGNVRTRKMQGVS